MSKFYQVKKTINGVEYTAQFNGVSAAMEAIDGCYIDGSSNISSKKLADYVFEHVIVNPKVTIDDFDSVSEMNEVAEWGRDVMQGNFRGEAIGRKAEKADKE